ncbi:calcium-activated potassium channel slowpoke [Caerostris darwini]|uniref:Calcium-activated potassium channel slowpoke n=1 Tax=Caerostris darwini TaxID=1538125 RepID=A0AAV4SBA9_9ARAC|nr:calcium-activated potassium channel slowpoke [Caerostris darwini]
METSTKLDETMNFTALNMTEEDLCLKERKWWCFLLSSVITCLVGIFIILFWRACVFMCCSSKSTNASSSQAASKTKVPGENNNKGANSGKEVAEIGFMTEAKDWAGELISGQSTTGRILVSLSLH